MTQAKSRRKQRTDPDVIRTSHPSAKGTKNLRLPRLTRISDSYVNATLGNKSGFATYSLTVGDATYRSVTWAIKTTAGVPGVTNSVAGVHYIKNELLSDYLDQVRIVPNGSELFGMSQAELLKRNAFHGISYGPLFTGFAFPGEGQYDQQRITDAYALGTKGMRSLTLELQLKAEFDPDTMEVVVVPHVVDIPKWPGLVLSNERQNVTFTGAGKHTYWDLPIGDDIKDLWIQGANIQRIVMNVDGDQMFDMDRASYEAFLVQTGRDPSVLDGDWYIDFHADGVARSLAALDFENERKRDARIKLDVYTNGSTTPVEFLVTHADYYNKIR